MFRFFENLVDPYSPYEDDMDPPAGLMQYLVYHTKPFRTLFLITGIATILAAVFEIFLLAAIGWVVDLMAAETLPPYGRITLGTSSAFWRLL